MYRHDDPLTYAGVIVVFSLTPLAASIPPPARGAPHVDPIAALRAE